MTSYLDQQAPGRRTRKVLPRTIDALLSETQQTKLKQVVQEFPKVLTG